jgi:choline dehydrogenase-like flavoprotein
MGSDASSSVVDRDLKVHGIDNLFVASSSVFPTSGQANSTLLAVAFAVRLADHYLSLKASEQKAVHCAA